MTVILAVFRDSVVTFASGDKSATLTYNVDRWYLDFEIGSLNEFFGQLSAHW